MKTLTKPALKAVISGQAKTISELQKKLTLSDGSLEYVTNEANRRGHVIDDLSSKVRTLTAEKIAAGVAYEKMSTFFSQASVEWEEKIDSLELKLAVKNLLLICSCGISLFFLTLAIATILLR